MRIGRCGIALSCLLAAGCGAETPYCYYEETIDGKVVKLDSVLPDTSRVCVTTVQMTTTGARTAVALDSVVPDTTRSVSFGLESRADIGR